MQRYLPILALFTSAVLAFIVYFPGIFGAFLFDDAVNIVENANIQIDKINFSNLRQALLSGDAGMLGRPVAMLSFALNYSLSGLTPLYFKLTNVAIHILNGVCIYMLTWRIVAAHHQRVQLPLTANHARWLGVATAAAWMLHPLNLTGVLYVVQRMTSLASLFSLLGMVCYLEGRRRHFEGKSSLLWIAAGFAIFLPLAAFSKENGVLLPVFLLLIEIAFFRFRMTSIGARRLLISLFGLTVGVPLVAGLVFLISNPEWVSAGYYLRDFTLAERLCTETRVLWDYIQWTVAPDITQLGLHHDDLLISTGLLSPLSTLAAGAGLLMLVAIGVACIYRKPIIGFGILFFLVGHSLESTFLSLELMHEHRNYLPIYGPLLIIFYYLIGFANENENLGARGIITVVLIVALGGLTYLRSTQWGNLQTMARMEVAHHPDSIRANIDMARIYATAQAASQIEATKNYHAAFSHYARAADLSSKDTLGLFGLIGLNARNNLPVDEAWVISLSKRLELYPFSVSSQNSLMGLEQCLSIKLCTLPQEMMEELLQAALRNPTLHGGTKSGVLFAWSNFLFKLKNDRDAATVAAYEAVNVAPHELDLQITLIQFLIDMEKYKDAKVRIDQLRQIDTGHRLEVTLRELENSIAILNISIR